MNMEDMIRQMQQQSGNMQPQAAPLNVPVAKLDEFITRCIKELHYDEHSLHQACMWKLQGQVQQGQQPIVVSYPEMEILPLVLQRLENGYGNASNRGEK